MRNSSVLKFLIFNITVLSVMDTSADTIQDVLRNVLSQNIHLKTERHRVQASKLSLNGSRSAFFPKVNAKMGMVYSDNKVIYKNHKASTAEVSLSVPILDSAIFSKYKTREKEYKLSKSVFKLKENDLLGQASIVVIGLDKLRRQYQITLEMKNKFQFQRRNMYKRFQAGEKTITDVRQVKSRLASHVARQFRQEEQMRILERDFYNLTRNYVPKIINVMKISMKKISSISAGASLKLNVLRESTRLAKQQYISQKMKHYPSLNLTASSLKSYDRFYKEKNTFLSESSAQVTLNIPLFGFGEIANNVESSIEKLLGQRLLLKYEKESVSQNHDEMIFKINNSKKILKSLDWAKGMAEKALEGIQTEFDSGNKGSEVLLNSEEELFLARLSYIEESARTETLKIEYLSLKNILKEYYKL